MKIERIDDKTIKCYLSFKELESYHVDYKDFMSKSENAQRLLHDVVDRAKEEVGYRPPVLSFEMQIMMVPDQGIVLTFFERDPAVEGDSEMLADEIIKRLNAAIRGAKDSANAGNHPPFADMGIPMPWTGENETHGGSEKAQESEETEPLQVCEAVYVFRSISRVIDYAAVLPATLRVKSSLYKMGDYYFIHMTKGGASYDRFSRACVQAMEFAALGQAGPGCERYLREHGSLLIEDKALRKLR